MMGNMADECLACKRGGGGQTHFLQSAWLQTSNQAPSVKSVLLRAAYFKY